MRFVRPLTFVRTALLPLLARHLFFYFLHFRFSFFSDTRAHTYTRMYAHVYVSPASSLLTSLSHYHPLRPF